MTNPTTNPNLNPMPEPQAISAMLLGHHNELSQALSRAHEMVQRALRQLAQARDLHESDPMREARINDALGALQSAKWERALAQYCWASRFNRHFVQGR